MAVEKIVSPGVFTKEVDQSFLPAAVAGIGAAIIGPTSRGPAGIPAVVTSYSEFLQKFGDYFQSGSGADLNSYKYLTNYAAQEYLKYADTLTVVRILNEGHSVANATVTSSGVGNSFTLYTLSSGADQNSAGTEGANNVLVSGSKNNLRWEVVSVNNARGTFNLQIRRGDDTSKAKNILETFNNVSLDPNSPDYIAKIVGDQYYTLTGSGTSDPYLKLSGDYPNKSRYVRVEVTKKTLNYLDENGTIRLNSLSASLPQVVSGTFSGGADGFVQHPRRMYETITNDNTQGFDLSGGGASGSTAYNDAIKLLANTDEYDFNLLALPGLVDTFANHQGVITTALDMIENRGDAFLIIDPAAYNETVANVVVRGNARNTNYAAEYWPWVKLDDQDLGRNVWVPAGTVIPGVYAFNDRVAAPWFAPAGLNRGGIDAAVQVERKLTQSNRDTLYDANINPIASFPNSGIVVYGQKTLQKKSSALDRVNVRRLLIAAKKFIASASKFLVFEQNTTVTRNRFLGIVDPYFENVQQRQGLYAFKVVMDETLNTPDVIDRNQLVGQIYLQPTRTAEFILIDFNILPTGAAFPD
jgi:phage tail sheath protein FI